MKTKEEGVTQNEVCRHPVQSIQSSSPTAIDFVAHQTPERNTGIDTGKLRASAYWA